MPDPLLYLRAAGAATITAALVVLMAQWAVARTGGTVRHLPGLLGVSLGATAGFLALQFQFHWPPAGGLDRLLTVLLPAVVVAESLAGFRGASRWFGGLLRLAVFAGSSRLLLHGSIYLQPEQGDWSRWEIAAVCLVPAMLLAGVWGLMEWLSSRSGDAALPLSVALATLCAGVLVMLAGYLKGGSASVPFAAALLGSVIASPLPGQRDDRNAVISLGVAALFGILFVGHFFGRLSTGTALMVFLAPTLSVASEIPRLRSRQPWQILFIRLVVVAIPLVFVLVKAKQDFDRDMKPLLMETRSRLP